jgi:branched-chain amino acid aminotransferase
LSATDRTAPKPPAPRRARKAPARRRTSRASAQRRAPHAPASRRASKAAGPAAPKPARLYAYVNGRILPAEAATVSVFDRGLVLGDGLFETVRAVGGRPQFFALHFRRLAKSAKRLRIRLPLDADGLQKVIRRLCARSRLDDATVRITLTRGRYLGGLAIDPSLPPTLIVTASPVTGLPPELYARGVKVVISDINKAAASGLDSSIKSTNYLANIFAKAQADRQRAYEAILLGPHGEIAELSTSSFFCVIGGKVLTPPLETGILPGITRQVLLRILKREGLPHGEARLFPKDVRRMQEAFLCSSVRGLVPITRIGPAKVGDGRPGPLYRRLREAYARACAAG